MRLLIIATIIACGSYPVPARAQQNIAAPPQLPQMTRWTDPTERAFTVSVPAGWRITGGTHRNAPIDARNYVVAESPDGKIKVWVNDPRCCPGKSRILCTSGWAGSRGAWSRRRPDL